MANDGTPTARRALEVAAACALLGLLLSFAQASAARPADVRLRAMRSVWDYTYTTTGDPAPSIEAARRLREEPRAPIYDGLRGAGSSFIYPPLATVFYAGLVDDEPDDVRRALARANHLLLLVIAGCALALLARRGAVHLWEVAAVAAASCMFYPLARAIELNQSTVGVCAALGLCAVTVRARMPLPAGVALALATSVKPHLALMLPLLWWHARTTTLVAVGTGGMLALASLAYAGIANHLAYVTQVLPTLSRGYFFYPNQSWNGLFNRLFLDLPLDSFTIAPAHPAVRALTALASLATLAGGALTLWRARALRVDPVWALLFSWLLATLASPVAWEHHYAPAAFLFALWYARLRDRPSQVDDRTAAVVGGAFALLGGYFEVRGLSGACARLAVSYLFVGAIGLAVITARALPSELLKEDA